MNLPPEFTKPEGELLYNETKVLGTARDGNHLFLLLKDAIPVLIWKDTEDNIAIIRSLIHAEL